MSVSSELLCSFELLKPLDSNALKSHIKKGRNKRQQMLNSPVLRGSFPTPCRILITNCLTACERIPPKCLAAATNERAYKSKDRMVFYIQQMSYRQLPFAPVEG